MKQTLAIACLVAASQAIRFSEPGTELNHQEDEALVRPAMISQNVLPGSNLQQGQSFSQALHHGDATPEQAEMFRDTTFSKSPVIQQAEDTITLSEKRDLIRQDNESIKIHHASVLEEPVSTEKPKSIAQIHYEQQAKSQMFASYVDDKDMDNDVRGDTMKVLGIADDTSAVQLNKLPYVDDVGRRAPHDSHEQYEWYPGDRRVYTDIEERFDFAQKSQPGQALVQASLPDVGTRDFSTGHELHAWYPGDRKYFPYEGQFDHAQVSAPSVAQLPDVGTRDFSAPHGEHAWYPGDRRHYDFESKFDHAQRKSAPRY